MGPLSFKRAHYHCTNYMIHNDYVIYVGCLNIWFLYLKVVPIGNKKKKKKEKNRPTLFPITHIRVIIQNLNLNVWDTQNKDLAHRAFNYDPSYTAHLPTHPMSPYTWDTSHPIHPSFYKTHNLINGFHRWID